MTPQEIAEARRAGAEGSAGRRGVVCARAADGRAAEVGAADGGAAGLMSGHEGVAVLRQWSGGRLLAEARAVFRAQSAGSGFRIRCRSPNGARWRVPAVGSTPALRRLRSRQ